MIIVYYFLGRANPQIIKYFYNDEPPNRNCRQNHKWRQFKIWYQLYFSIYISEENKFKVILLFQAAPKKPTFVEKPIGGAKNGGTRMVRVKKAVNDYPTIDA